MSFLDQVTKGQIKENDFIIVAGVAGVGKTTFATSWPDSITMDIEGGSSFLDVTRLPRPKNFQEIMAQINELNTSKHSFKTIVIDSLDHMEPLVNQAACEENGWKTIEDGSFGKGYAAAFSKWLSFTDALKSLRQKMNLILICHTTVKKIADPMQMQEYDRHELKLRDKTAALFKESVDAILFCTFETNLLETKTGKVRAIGDGARVMLTQARPSHEAKNRYGLPYRLPLEFSAYERARERGAADSLDALRERINEGISALKDKEVAARAEKAAKEAGDNAEKLNRILNQLLTMLAA